jgi:DNA-directed RNA polymerase specialized sigma24 family protein
MSIRAINADEEHNHYVGQVYEEHYARLRRYFLTQLHDAAEADECAHETISRLFSFMKDKEWEAEYVFVYLMRIAGRVCTRKLNEKGARRAACLDGKGRGLFDRIRAEVAGAVRERSNFVRFVLSPLDGHGRHPSGA